MKPISPAPNGRSTLRPAQRPLVDWKFRPETGDPFGRALYGGGFGGPHKRSIHRMSDEYFRQEMHREFFIEAIAFLVIVLVSAWPLTTMVLMLMQLIK